LSTDRTHKAADPATLPGPPAYGVASLAEVLPSAAAAIGVPGYWDLLGVGGNYRGVVVALIDGLGWQSLQQHASLAPSIVGGTAIDAAVPTTTPVGLGSLGTGTPPGSHGLVGASFRIAGAHSMLSPLSWSDSPMPRAVQPESTVLEDVARRGIDVFSISARAYEGSGLTLAALRGGLYRGADSLGEKVAEVASIAEGHDRFLSYLYWPDLDRTGHGHGVDSDHWRAELQHVDYLVQRLRSVLPADTALIITADHGMVDCAPADRFVIEDSPHLSRDVVRLGGEPRCRFIYTRSGKIDDVRRRWQEELGDRAWVLSRQEWISAGYSGIVHDHVDERLGDVIALARGNTSLASTTVDSVVSQLRGQHGSISEAEMKIPFIVHSGTAETR
jgi:hypothetical protein